jgi:citrate lyase subunit beta/citryl-CoA lyase
MEMIRKAAESAADEIILDLEDAVAEDEKEAARKQVIEAASDLDWTETALCCRINALDTPHAYRDLVTVVEAVSEQLGSIIVPKVTRAEDVYAVDRWLSGIEDNTSIAAPIPLQLLIEETAAIHNIDEIAAESDRVDALIFGSGDYSASVGIDHPSARRTEDAPIDDVWYYARNVIVNAAKSNGQQAIDGPYVDFSDPDSYVEEARRAKALGFDGKWAIHPSQIELANNVFSPSEDDIQYARAVMNALDEGETAGEGAVNFDGIMLDVAHRRHAARTLERARKLGLID